jgi:diguanylate cyclase (GGDEF)-like protein
MRQLWGRAADLSHRSRRRIVLDIAVIFGVAFLLRILTFDMELFERAFEFSRAHEQWELDEIYVTVALMSVALIFFSLRRVQDQRRELALRHAAEQHATILALQDPLTGLPNRRKFEEALSGVTEHGNGLHALLVIDLDGFKPINDVFGHQSGDEALRTIARRLTAMGDPRILSARLGGDEFALIVRNLTTAEEAERVAERVIAAIEIPIIAGGVEHRLDVSVGVALIDHEAGLAEEHLRRADVALYQAKETVGSAYTFYEPALDSALTERVRLEGELRAALANDSIAPFYQPIVDLRTGAILKFEALARWRDPKIGDIPPARFIPLAEDRGLIGDVTEKIVRQALRDAADWPDPVRLSINLSPVLVQTKAFGLRLVKLLADSGFPPSRLEVELTERALQEDFEVVRVFLQNLRAIGVHVSLDDFGTGYSSLSRLRRLPFDDIKIDRSFVESMSVNKQAAVIVRAILDMGAGLGMTITAEGIEDPEQRKMLISEGCTQGQGFLFSEAVPAEQALALLESRRKAASG